MLKRYLVALILAACLPRIAAAASVVTPAPNSAHPTQTITITGSGFADSEAVDVYFDTTDTLLLVTSSTGTLTGSLTIPTAAVPGVHSITAIGRRSSDAAQNALTVTTAWSQFGFGAAHVGVNPYENVLSASTVPMLGTLWNVSNGADGGTPIVAKNKVYVATSSGLEAFNAATGAVIWNANLNASFVASPTLVGNTLYIGDFSGNYYAINATTGATIWKVKLTGYFYGSATVSNGTIYVGSYDGSFYALNTSNGAVVWSFVPSGSTLGTDTSAAVVGGKVYYGGYDGKVYCLDAATGAMVWSYTTSGVVESSPTIVNGTLYIGADDYYVYALGTSSSNAGALIWSYKTGGNVYSSPVVYNGHVYVGSSDGKLYALNARDGSVYFTYATNGLVRSASAANGVIYFTSQDYMFYAITPYGGLLTSGSIGYSFFGSPAVSDGRVFVATDDGDLYAFAPNAGTDAVPVRPHVPRPSSLHPDMSLQVTR